MKDSSIYAKFQEKAATQNKELKLWAPELYYSEQQQRWIMVHTTSVNFSSIALGKEGELVFKTPIDKDCGVVFGHQHDPSLFIDPAEGSPWLVSFATKLYKIKKDFSGFEGEQCTIKPSNRTIGHEGSQIIKVGSKYVLFGTAWSSDKMREGTYNLYYCTANSVTGPYGPRKFVGRCLGHGTVFQDLQGRWWCTAFQNGTLMSPAELAAIKDFPKDATDPTKLKAITTNQNGLTLVPLEIKEENGDISIKTLDPNYANPGPEEVQKF